MLFRFFFSVRNFLLLTLISGVFAPACLRAQESKFDSLLLVLKTAKQDTVLIKTYAALTDECSMDEILVYAAPAIVLCEKALAQKREPRKTYLSYYAGLLNNVGFYHSRHGDVLKALAYYQKAAGILEKINSKKEAAILLNNVAYIYQNQGDFAKSLDFYFRNLRIQEEIKDDRGMAYTLSSISYGYDIQGDSLKAKEYNTRALVIFEKIHDKRGLAMTINNRGLLVKKTEPRKALAYYKRGLVLYQGANDSSGVVQSLSNISSVYLRLGESDTALLYAYQALEIIKKKGYKGALGTINLTIARIMLKKGNYPEAKTYALSALSLNQKQGNPIDIMSASSILKQIYGEEHKYKEALAMYQLEMQMNDSVVNESNKKEFLKKQLEYDYEKKELQNKVKQEQRLSFLKLENEKRNSRKNIIVYGLIFLALILAVSMFYLYKFFKQKNIINANRNNELKQKLLLSQMNPHFIFNSVDNIQSLILQKQDEEAVSYLGKFSKLTRQILENSSENYITLREEVAMTENYLSIQRLLYTNKFTFRVAVDEAIDTGQILLPPMLTQPFIENAIKHGLKQKDNGGRIEVRFFMKGEALYFEVTDNGSGLQSKEDAAHRSMAIGIVTERLKHHAGKKEITIHVHNRMENNVVSGVRSAFEIPYIYN